jgi:hypothetical protein
MAIITTIQGNQPQFFEHRVNMGGDAEVRRARGGKNSAAPDDDIHNAHAHERSMVAFGQRQAINASLNKAAVSIRIADRTIKTIGAHITSMRSYLETIVKHYPPFLNDSPERIRALRNFSAFRREIDALTFPRDERTAQIMPDPAVLSRAEHQAFDVGPGSLQSRQIHTGPAGLDIPALTDMASAAEIDATLASLDVAQDRLARSRARLSSNAADLLPTGRFTDMVAEHMSIDVGRSIAREPSQGLTGMRAFLLQMA